MERHRYVWFEKNGQSKWFNVWGSTEVIREVVGTYLEAEQKVGIGLFWRLERARAVLSAKEYDQYSAELGAFIETGPDKTIHLEILSSTTSHVRLQMRTDWPDDLKELRAEARKLIENLETIADLLWKITDPILLDARLALPALEFDIFCAECGIYNELDESGVLQFELLPPPEPLDLAKAIESSVSAPSLDETSNLSAEAA